MKGVSEVIAIILILMITIAIAGLAYTFMSATMSSTTSAASSSVTTTTSNMFTSFAIESIDVAKVYIRNTGQNPISSLSVYVNDEPAKFNMTPATIASGQIGTAAIYSFIAEGDTIKITTPNGFSTSKKAPDPCAKAVGCWKFDEGSGLTAYDSSPYGNMGMLVNGTAWTSGRYGGGLLFDGTNDYVNAGNDSSLKPTDGLTIEAWIKPNGKTSYSYQQTIAGNEMNGAGYVLRGGSIIDPISYSSISFGVTNGTYQHQALCYTSGLSIGEWYHVVGVVSSNGKIALYLDGVECQSNTYFGGVAYSSKYLRIGNLEYYPTRVFNGTIDEVRIYNKAIY